MEDSVDEHLKQACLNDTAGKARGALTQLKCSHFELCVISTSTLAESTEVEGFTLTLILFGSLITCSRDRGAHKGQWWVLLEVYPSSGSRQVWVSVSTGVTWGSVSSCWHCHQAVCFCAFVPHNGWCLAKVTQVFGVGTSFQFTARKLNSHLLVHNCEKAHQ